MAAWSDAVIATHSGLRGRPGAGLTPAVVRQAVGGLLALLVREELPLSVGVARDERPDGEGLSAEVIACAVETGAEVVDFGAVSTPAAKLAARRRGLGGAVIVTGSHLGPDWNGLKLVAGPSYAPVDLRELPAPLGRSPRPGRVSRDATAVADHVTAVCGSVDEELVRRARLGVRCTGGVGHAAVAALERLGCRPDASTVDLALWLDADGDRLALVDERGTALDSDAVLALVALARGARSVVKGADTSRVVDELVTISGGSVSTVVPGELHLVRELAASGGDLAGEGNGGVVVPSVGMARDGLAAAASILALRAGTGRPLSALAAELPRYAIRRSTVLCSNAGALGQLAAGFGVPVPGDLEAGVRVERPGGAWGLVRRSATEPVLRITTEARTADAADALHAEMRAALVRSEASR